MNLFIIYVSLFFLRYQLTTISHLNYPPFLAEGRVTNSFMSHITCLFLLIVLFLGPFLESPITLADQDKEFLKRGGGIKG